MSKVTQAHADELLQGAKQLGIMLSTEQQQQLLAYLGLVNLSHFKLNHFFIFTTFVRFCST